MRRRVDSHSIEDQLYQVREEIEALRLDVDYEEVLSFCLTKILSPGSDDHTQAAKLEYILQAIELCSHTPNLPDSEVQRLYQMAHLIIRNLGLVGERRAPLQVAARLNLYMGWHYIYQQKFIEAQRYLDTSETHLKCHSDEIMTLIVEGQALCSYYQGSVYRASQLFEGLLTIRNDDKFHHWVHWSLHCQRLIGHLGKFERVYSEYVSRFPMKKEDSKLRFENYLLHIKKIGVAELVSEIKKRDPAESLREIVILVCYYFIKEHRKSPSRMVKISTIRRKVTKKEMSLSEQSALDCLALIQEAYDSSRSIEVRLQEILALHPLIIAMPDPEIKILCLAVCCKWLHRFHQTPVLGTFFSYYQDVDLMMCGQARDSLALGESIPASGRFLSYWLQKLVELNTGQVTTKLETGIKRSYSILKVAGLAFVQMVREKYGDLEEENIRKGRAQMGENLIFALVKLRGPLLKIGQNFLFGDMFDELLGSTSHEIFKNNFRFDTQTLVNVVEAEFGRPLLDIFESFEWTPIASASVGQVHRAVLPSGEQVVVKIQYPGVEQISRQDLKAGRGLIAPLFKRIFPEYNTEPVIKLLSEIILDELDYLKEASNLQTFYDFFKDHERIIIPKVYHDYTTRKVIVMEYCSGESLYEFMKRAEIEDKENIFELLVEYGCSSYFELNRLQSDCHPQNFLVSGDRLVALDFGLVTEMDQKRVELWRRIFSHLLNKEIDQATKTLAENFGDDYQGFEDLFRDVFLDDTFPIDDVLNGETSMTSDRMEYIKDKAMMIMLGDRFQHQFTLFSPEDIMSLTYIFSLHRYFVLFGISLNIRKLTKRYFQTHQGKWPEASGT